MELFAIHQGQYTGCNKKIEQIKYFEKNKLGRKVKKYVFIIFKKAICRGGNWRTSRSHRG